MIPKTTTPLTKFIRTTEGILLTAATVYLVVLPAVGEMSWTKSGTAAAVLAGVATVSRSILKAVASLSPIFGDPIVPQGVQLPAGDEFNGPTKQVGPEGASPTDDPGHPKGL